MTIPFPSSRVSASRFKSAPNNNPDTFASSFDLLHELSTNKDEYSSDETQATVYKFPGSLLMQIDRTCAQVVQAYSTSRPGRNRAICACISYGVSVLSTHPDVKSILVLRDKLDLLTEDKNSKLAQIIWNNFDDFPFNNSNTADSRARRLGIYLSKELKKTLTGIKSRLGLTTDSIIILCIQLSLCDQEWVTEERKQEMRAAIKEFYAVTRIRKAVFEALFTELERNSVG